MPHIRFVRLDFAAGSHLAPHHHEQGQILFARSGTLDLSAGGRLFILPASRLAWLPPGVTHAIRFRTKTQLRTAYVPQAVAANAPATVRILQASPLFREMLLRLVEDRRLRGAYRAGLEAALIGELALLRDDAFSLKLPRDRRARRVANALIETPNDPRNLEQWATLAACSPKTLSRLFSAQTDLPFRLWRRHARLLTALELLEGGCSVTRAAHAVGFSTSSAFTEAFRLTFGYPPTAKP